MTDLDRREAFLHDIVRKAGGIALDGFARDRREGGFAAKGRQDFLTETDGAVEAALRASIADAFPEDSFFGEETGGAGGDAVWVVDPIDGTANFARGVPHFCISVAFVQHGVTELGAINAPAMDELYVARRGHGATRNGRPLRVAPTQGFDLACVEFGWNTRVTQDRYLDVLTRILNEGANVRRAASGALGLAWVADGRSDAYLELHMNSWDCLAGLLIAEEAGARVAPFLKQGTLTGGGPVFASVPALAGALSRASGIALD